jgi:hypothetical protein
MADQAKDELSPGTWVTDATGFAAVPPRAQSDLAAVCEEEREGRDEDESRPDTGSGPQAPGYGPEARSLEPEA